MERDCLNVRFQEVWHQIYSAIQIKISAKFGEISISLETVCSAHPSYELVGADATENKKRSEGGGHQPGGFREGVEV